LSSYAFHQTFQIQFCAYFISSHVGLYCMTHLFIIFHLITQYFVNEVNTNYVPVRILFIYYNL
jgi:hypothetical protein